MDYPEEQPEQFATTLDERAAIWVILQMYRRVDAMEISGEDMRRGREAVREIGDSMIRKQPRGGLFISTY